MAGLISYNGTGQLNQYTTQNQITRVVVFRVPTVVKVVNDAYWQTLR